MNLTQLISEPTRPNPHDSSKSSLIDIIPSNKPDKHISSGLFVHAPLRKYKVKAGSSPLFTAESADLFNPRNRAWTQPVWSKTSSHWLVFRQLRNRCTTASRKAKSDYYIQYTLSPAHFMT